MGVTKAKGQNSPRVDKRKLFILIDRIYRKVKEGNKLIFNRKLKGKETLLYSAYNTQLKLL